MLNKHIHDIDRVAKRHPGGGTAGFLHGALARDCLLISRVWSILSSALSMIYPLVLVRFGSGW